MCKNEKESRHVNSNTREAKMNQNFVSADVAAESLGPALHGIPGGAMAGSGAREGVRKETQWGRNGEEGTGWEWRRKLLRTSSESSATRM